MAPPVRVSAPEKDTSVSRACAFCCCMDAQRPLGFAIAASKELCQLWHVKTCTGGSQLLQLVPRRACRYALQFPSVQTNKACCSVAEEGRSQCSDNNKQRNCRRDWSSAAENHNGKAVAAGAETQLMAGTVGSSATKSHSHRSQPGNRTSAALLPDSFVLSGKDRGGCISALLCSPCVS